jgi:hypothetical protein
MCSGAMTVSVAGNGIAANWRAFYKSVFGSALVG